ncbi:MAG: ribonuclease HI family protein [Gemmataceae bacterium]|nr:ribonuclease HI family protein [Gemmataceae bacterium]
MAQLEIHTDGASRGNPGDASFAFLVRKNGSILKEDYGCLGTLTNNQAEYTALVRALDFILKVYPKENVLIHSDSELMVKQVNGEYRVKSGDLKPLFEEAKELIGKIEGTVRLVHVRREANKDADALCNRALDEEG